MLQLVIVLSDEGWDDEEEKFLPQETYILELEHSLVALSKWESKFKKPFLESGQKTDEEARAYVEAMLVNPFTPLEVLDKLSQANIKTINEYIEDPMTATVFHELVKETKSREKITSELIYYWIVSYQIPFEVETWHLNRLFTLIKVFNIKSAKPKKVPRGEMLARRRALNEQRRAQLGSSG